MNNSESNDNTKRSSTSLKIPPNCNRFSDYDIPVSK